MFDNNISIDTTYNTLYTGYDTLNRVLNTAESLITLMNGWITSLM